MSSAVLLVCSAAPTFACTRDLQACGPMVKPRANPSFLYLPWDAAHVAVVLAGERLWRFTRRETCLASNANIGGEGWAAERGEFM